MHTRVQIIFDWLFLNMQYLLESLEMALLTASKYWIAFLDEKHLIDEAIKFSSTLSDYAKLAVSEEACVPMGFQEMFFNL